jgi:hypothetical protein
MVASQNGWRANDRSVIGPIDIPGGRLSVRTGSVGVIFQHLATRFHNEVEALVWPGNWGYAERPVRGGTDLSNHASGTAIDLNAPRHPLGTAPSANYSAAQINKIHEIVNYYEGVIRWGGDYVGRKDGMHFEINDGVTEAQVDRIAAKIRGGVAPTPSGPVPAGTDDGRWIQQRLVYWGFPVVVDGIVGAKTTEAVSNFQRSKGLAVDGIVGVQTRAALAANKTAVAPPWPLPRDHYFGLITGPAKSHGGINASERANVKLIQQALINKGYAGRVSAGWADGKYEQATKDAVTRFQRAEMPRTTRFGEVWWDDWAKLLS